jgi:hypothetical protein
MSDKVRLAFAIVVTAVFLAFGTFLVLNADTTNESQWEHWVYVFGAAEAIAFTAIGWVFGKEVNRERAETAEETARASGARSKLEIAKGAKLAGLVRGGAGGTAGRRRLEELGGGSADGLTEALDYALKMYPDTDEQPGA